MLEDKLVVACPKCGKNMGDAPATCENQCICPRCGWECNGENSSNPIVTCRYKVCVKPKPCGGKNKKETVVVTLSNGNQYDVTAFYCTCGKLAHLNINDKNPKPKLKPGSLSHRMLEGMSVEELRAFNIMAGELPPEEKDSFDYLVEPICDKCGHLYEDCTCEDQPICGICLQPYDECTCAQDGRR